jgi:hypothetical protein
MKQEVEELNYVFCKRMIQNLFWLGDTKAEEQKFVSNNVLPPSKINWCRLTFPQPLSYSVFVSS